MPAYPHLLTDTIPWGKLQGRINAVAMLGTPYTKDVLDDAAGVAKVQATALAAKLQAAGGPGGMADKDVIALIAYVQRLGMDIRAAQGAH